jgi:hypothetical protein
MPMTTLAALTISPAYCGPPDSGNGGYVAGLLGGFLSGPCDVRLQSPTPLGVPLDVRAAEDDVVELRHGGTTIATAHHADVSVEVPACPPRAVVEQASLGYAGFARHVFPTCFVCGTARGEHEGLRIYAGALERDGFHGVASPWTPHAALAGTRGKVRPEFLWAVLDCPGYFAVATDGRVMLLGSLAVRIDGAVSVGEPCTVLGWRRGGDGRKQFAATALYGADGTCVARAVATWIQPKR